MSVVGSVAVRVVPSFDGLHQGIARGFGGASGAASRAAGEVGATAGSQMVTRISERILGGNFTNSFRTAFGRGKAIAEGEGGVAGASWAVRTASSISANSGEIASAVTQPFTGALSGISSVGNATGLSFANAEVSSLSRETNGIQAQITRPFTGALDGVTSAGNVTGLSFAGAAASSLGSNTAGIENAVTQPFSGVMSDVVSVGNATGLSFSDAAVSSLGSQANPVQYAITSPFSGVMSNVTSIGNATGLNFSDAAASSIAQGGATAGQGFMSNLGDSIGESMGAITAGAEKHAIDMGGVFGSGFVGTFTKKIAPLAGILTLGSILGAGFNRLADIDEAEAKFRGLGYTAEEIDTQMDSALSSVEGTTIGLNQAATASVGAAGAGVEMGQDMTDWLTAIGDATAMSSVEYDHMAQMMNKVQGQGRVIGGDLQQMGQNGFEAATILAQHMGIGVDEVRELASQGEITADIFQEAIEGQIGGAAKEMNQTLRGSIGEAVFQLAILGAEFLESSGLTDMLKNAMQGFSSFLENTVTPAISDLFDWFDRWGHVIRPIAAVIAGIVAGFVAFKVAATAIAFVPVLLNLIAGGFRGIGRSIAAIPIIGWIAMAVGALVSFFAYTETGQALWQKITDWFAAYVMPIFQRVWDGIVAGVSAVVAWFQTFGDETTQQGAVVTSIWEWIQGAISAVVGWITGTAWPAIQSAWSGISSGAQWLWGVMESVWGWIQGAISGTVDWMTGTAWPMIQSVWDGIVFGAQWLWGILEPIFIMITAVFLYVGQTLWNIYTSYVKFMWDAFVAIVQWVWSSILQPTFNFIVSAFQALGTAFMWVWDNVVKPMWDMFVAIVRWVWTSIVQPIFQFIVNAFRGLGNSFMAVWTGILQPVFNFVGAIIRWLWENVARPMFNSITTAWRTMANWLRNIWTGTIRPAIDAFGNFVVSLYRNYVRPAIDWISDKWEWLSGKISDVWGTIKGYLQDFGDFVKDTLSNAIESGVDTIKSIWDTVAGFFRTPINWVINTVWNDGLREAYNAVADLINADTLPRVSGLGSVPAFAEGGYARRGWALVGEKGPELVNFSNPGRVYTADETRDALAGANPSSLTPEEVHAMADGSRPGQYGVGGNWFTRGARWVADKTGISDAIDWVRGKLADGFRAVVKPVVNRVSDFMSEWGGVGSLAGDFMDWGVEGIASLIDAKDQEQFSDGSYDGEFTANPGGFNRPMAGPITSRAGTRSYWGAFGNQHYGVDIGGPIGTAVRAMFSGVIRAISGGGNNRTVVMNHGGYDTAYMHMSAITRAIGEQVKGGDIIARSGTAGSGPHGHFEYHPGGYYNPSMSAINSLIRDKGGLLYPGMNQVLNDTGRAEYVFNQRQFDNLNRIAANSNGGEGWTINQNNYQSGSQYRDAQDLRMTFRRERKKAGV